MTEVAARLPLKIICDMMGVPESDYDRVFHCSNIILSFGDPEYVPEGDDPVLAFMNAAEQLNLLMADLATSAWSTRPRTSPRPSSTRTWTARRSTDTELASFFILLVVAGNETTRNAISHGLLAMTEHPDQRALWQADFGSDRRHRRGRDRPLGLARHLHAPHHGRRHACSARPIAEGDKVILFYNSANRDEDVFTDPFTLRRAPNPNPHVGLRGAGPALLPRRASGPPGDRRHVPRALPAPARHSRRGRARPPALHVHQRHQAPRLHLHPGRKAF